MAGRTCQDSSMENDVFFIKTCAYNFIYYYNRTSSCLPRMFYLQYYNRYNIHSYVLLYDPYQLDRRRPDTFSALTSGRPVVWSFVSLGRGFFFSFLSVRACYIEIIRERGRKEIITKKTGRTTPPFVLLLRCYLRRGFPPEAFCPKRVFTRRVAGTRKRARSDLRTKL